MFEEEQSDENKILKEHFYNWIAIAFEEHLEVMPILKEIKDNDVKL
jgi:hypothetical protein